MVKDKVLSSVLKDDYISVVLATKDGIVPFQLTPSHPTFLALHKAIAKGNTDRVPKLVTLARAIANKTHGRVTFTKSGIQFRGTDVAPVISRMAARSMKETGNCSAWLKFVDNLFKNPEKRAREEFIEFLEKAEEGKYAVPMTDDGCVLGYKAVKDNYTDVHTGTMDNSVGQTRMMPRKAVDADRRNECSRGFHFCSLGYLGSFSGQKIMAVKVNPKDIVAIPKDYNFSKGRTWKYEVVYEVGDKTDETSKTHAPVMLQAVVPVAAERKQVLVDLLAIPAVKRAIRRGKIKKTTIMKQSYGQLVKLYRRFAKMIPVAPEQSTVLRNCLMDARNAAGLTVGQVAKELDITYKAAWAAEHSDNPRQDTIDKYLEAIANLTGSGKGDRAVVTFPKPATKAAAASASPSNTEQARYDAEDSLKDAAADDEDYEYGYGEEDEEDEDNEWYYD